MLLDQIRLFARYNTWANRRIDVAIRELDEAYYRHDGGAFFKSIHGTWSHLLVADRIWLGRLGVDIAPEERPTALDQKPYHGRIELLAARARTDALIEAVVDRLDEAALAAPVHYRTLSGRPEADVLAHLLAHLFNHQTHHRGQIHALLTGLGREAPPLDLIYCLRELG